MVSVPALASTNTVFNGSGNYDSFAQLFEEYSMFLPVVEGKITFSDMAAGFGAVGNRYAAKGVKFSNEDNAILLKEGYNPVDGWYQGKLAGFGNHGLPNKKNLTYNKLYNDDPDSPLTITFDEPVSAVGSYIANSAGNSSWLTVNAYNLDGELLATILAHVKPWGDYDNIEGFWGLARDHADIHRITILTSGNYAITTVSDLEWSRYTSGDIMPAGIPEPSSALLVLAGTGILALRRRRRSS